MLIPHFIATLTPLKAISLCILRRVTRILRKWDMAMVSPYCQYPYSRRKFKIWDHISLFFLVFCMDHFVAIALALCFMTFNSVLWLYWSCYLVGGGLWVDAQVRCSDGKLEQLSMWSWPNPSQRCLELHQLVRDQSEVWGIMAKWSTTPRVYID